MNKSDNGHEKWRGKERFCTWEKIMKIRARQGELMVTELNVAGENSDTPRYFVFDHGIFILGSFSASVQILKMSLETNNMKCERRQKEGSGKERRCCGKLWRRNELQRGAEQ